ncbi:hypothetical protein OE88DRAFT_1732859 [Heliocybe sulcata]|uniref:Ribosomal protein S5 domain 2-like protein n=1 Tax=Heliocybe sulcata TaxID=5364 RepID=A0A5C3NA75_9AGAM|nr:hypothetical protein OE88DRAFT_1732859 [Heliocybe sulcata]
MLQVLVVRQGCSRITARQLPAFLRTYASFQQQSSFVPPAQFEDVVSANPNARGRERSKKPKFRPWDTKDKPASPAYYTTRPSFYDTIVMLNEALQAAHRALRDCGLYPLPPHALTAIPEYPTLYMNPEAMADMLGDGQKLTTTRHRRIIDVLGELHDCRKIARAAGLGKLEEALSGIIAPFERPNKEEQLNQGKRKPVKFDEYGRSYTVGRRKESSARVWLIPTVPFEEQIAASSSLPPPSELAIQESGTASANDLPVTQVLVNNIPITEYFANHSDRENIIRPFKIAGLLGAYNVFALVRGGGTTGQSGAVITGIARGLLAQEHRRAEMFSEHIHTSFIEPIDRQLSQAPPPLVSQIESEVKAAEASGMDMNMGALGGVEEDTQVKEVRRLVQARRDKEAEVRKARQAAETVDLVLRRSKLTRRDPRMVERKKTGLRKSRARYAWVKR